MVGDAKCRLPNGVIGVLIKEYFPGMVEMPSGETVLATKWEHYEAKADGVYQNKANAVISRFWVSFYRST